MWTAALIKKYHDGTKAYIEDNFVKTKVKVDCADLALSYLVDFAHENSLPITIKYYASKKWQKYQIKAKQKDIANAKSYVNINFGALNVIDNTKPIAVSEAKPGDLIMSKWAGGGGHTRVIIEIKTGKTDGDASVTFYQGNLPAAIPIKKTETLKDIDFGEVTDKRPRRWRFEAFT